MGGCGDSQSDEVRGRGRRNSSNGDSSLRQAARNGDNTESISCFVDILVRCDANVNYYATIIIKSNNPTS